jgi:transposase
MGSSGAVDAAGSQEWAQGRSQGDGRDIVRASHRHAVARFAEVLWALYDGVQSLQSVVAPRDVEADFRHFGGDIAGRPAPDRQHDREGASGGQWRKRGEKNQAIGISRGGRSTKIHAVVDGKGRPLNFAVTGGEVHDSNVVAEVLDTPRPPLAVAADKAYDSEKVRQQIRDEGAVPVIPSRSTAIKKAHCPKRIYRRRHKIENYFCRIKDWRRLATRYDKLARNFLATAALVGALYWIQL